MFTYFILGVVLLIAIYFLARWFATSSPSTLAKWLKGLFFGIGGAATLYLAVTGKVYLAFIPLALTVLPRLMAQFMRSGYGGPPASGGNSEIETDYVRMTLEHDTGDMHGLVLRGKHAGHELSELSQAQLVEVLTECRQHDEQAARLIETYLDRMFGAEWRGQDGPPGSTEDGSSANDKRANRTRADAMTKEEAYEVLGLTAGASPADIRDAHHKLMLKIHPDQGGSNYLAAKINQAKDVLLGGA